jgi:hypothetical protein
MSDGPAAPRRAASGPSPACPAASRPVSGARPPPGSRTRYAGRIPAGAQPGVTADDVRTRKTLIGDASNVPHLAAGA